MDTLHRSHRSRLLSSKRHSVSTAHAPHTLTAPYCASMAAEQRVAAVESAILELNGAVETIVAEGSQTRATIDGLQSLISGHQENVGKVV